MGRFLKEYDKECMKMAILKHEETFRQQVLELHRLYRIQKLLMRDMKHKQLNKEKIFSCAQADFDTVQENDSNSFLNRSTLRNQKPYRTLNLDLSADEFIEKAEEDKILDIEQDVNIELTLTTGSNWIKKQGNSLTYDSAMSSSSPSTSYQKFREHECELQHVENADMRYQNGVKSALDFEEGLRENRLRQPPWFFQCLSLKMV